MTLPIEWQSTGPLGFPSSTDYRYWVPTRPDGTFRAWFHFRGLPGNPHDKLLGDNLSTIEEAKRLCEDHARALVVSTRLEVHQFLDVLGSEWFITEDDLEPAHLESLRDDTAVLFTRGSLVYQGSAAEEVPGLLSLEDVRKIMADSPLVPMTPLVSVFRRWRAGRLVS